MDEITTEAELRELLGEPTAAAANKDRSALDAIHRQWLAASPFCLVATSGADGACDVSPKGDPPGFTSSSTTGPSPCRSGRATAGRTGSATS